MSIINFNALLNAEGLRRGAGRAFSDSRFWVFWVHLGTKTMNPKMTQTPTHLTATLGGFCSCKVWPCSDPMELAHAVISMGHVEEGPGDVKPWMVSGLCTCEKLEVHNLLGHTRGWWWQDMSLDPDAPTSSLCSWQHCAPVLTHCDFTSSTALFYLLRSSEAA